MPHVSAEARRIYQREYYQKTRKHRRKSKKAKWIEKLGGCCTECGYDRCIEALEFHHLDPSEKDFAVFDTWRSDESIEEEIKKCKLLCANCHREYHAGLLGPIV